MPGIAEVAKAAMGDIPVDRLYTMDQDVRGILGNLSSSAYADVQTSMSPQQIVQEIERRVRKFRTGTFEEKVDIIAPVLRDMIRNPNLTGAGAAEAARAAVAADYAKREAAARAEEERRLRASREAGEHASDYDRARSRELDLHSSHVPSDKEIAGDVRLAIESKDVSVRYRPPTDDALRSSLSEFTKIASHDKASIFAVAAAVRDVVDRHPEGFDVAIVALRKKMNPGRAPKVVSPADVIARVTRFALSTGMPRDFLLGEVRRWIDSNLGAGEGRGHELKQDAAEWQGAAQKPVVPEIELDSGEYTPDLRETYMESAKRMLEMNPRGSANPGNYDSVEAIADGDYRGSFEKYYPQSANEEIDAAEEGTPYYGRRVIWVGEEGKMLRVGKDYAMHIAGNIFYGKKLNAIAEWIKDGNRPVFHAPYGEAMVVDTLLIQESQRAFNHDNEDGVDRPLSTGDDDLDQYLLDPQEYIEVHGAAPENLHERLTAAEKAGEGDYGALIVTIRDGNHRAFGSLLGGEPYIFVRMSGQQHDDLMEAKRSKKLKPWQKKILDALE